MEACELVRLIVNKAIVPTETKRAGNPGYGQQKAIKTLVYARLKGLPNDTRITQYLKRHPLDQRGLGLNRTPNRTTIGRWWKRYLSVLEETFQRTAKMLKEIVKTTHLIADSTPLIDHCDPEAKCGYTHRGRFKGFKIHVAVNQLGLPLSVVVSTGNRFDSKFLPVLLEGQKTDYVLADAGYHSLENIRAVRDIGAVPIIAVNPRRKGKESKVSNAVFFAGRRYPVEQFNCHIKHNVLRGCWSRPRGLVKKTAMIMAGLICVLANAILALLCAEPGLKVASKYWD